MQICHNRIVLNKSQVSTIYNLRICYLCLNLAVFTDPIQLSSLLIAVVMGGAWKRGHLTQFSKVLHSTVDISGQLAHQRPHTHPDAHTPQDKLQTACKMRHGQEDSMFARA